MNKVQQHDGKEYIFSRRIIHAFSLEVKNVIFLQNIVKCIRFRHEWFSILVTVSEN